MNLNKNSRAGKYGTELKCCQCESINVVYHMAWFAITCQSCKQPFDKFQWQLIKHRKRQDEFFSIAEFRSMLGNQH